MIEDLSDAELRVAVLSARGCSNREAAAQLYVSVNTIKTHTQRMLQRLGCRSRTELVARLMLDARFRLVVGSHVEVLDLTVEVASQLVAAPPP